MTSIISPLHQPCELPSIQLGGSYNPHKSLIPEKDHAIFLSSVQPPQTTLPNYPFHRELTNGWTAEDFNFLDPHSPMYNPLTLISAGVAHQAEPYSIYTNLKYIKGTWRVIDSGGYQLSTGGGSVAIRSKNAPFFITRWAEKVYGSALMTLDVPTALIGNERYAKYQSLSDCLNPTLKNIEGFLRVDSNLPLYSVLHGHSRRHKLAWLDTVKPFMAHSTGRMKGWAFPCTGMGAYGTNLDDLIYMICKIISEGLLGDNPDTNSCVDMLHFLGTGTPASAAIINTLSVALNRYLRRQGLLSRGGGSPVSLIVTFDVSNCYQQAGRYGKYISSPDLCPSKFTAKWAKLPTNDNSLFDSTQLVPGFTNSPLKGTVWGDIIVKMPKIHQIDSIGILTVAHHNTYMLWDLLEQAKAISVMPHHIAKDHAPTRLLDKLQYIYAIFDSEDPLRTFTNNFDGKFGGWK